MLADVALFRIEQGAFSFYDIHMNARSGKELVRNTLTIVNGRELPVTADGPPAPWIELSEAQQALIERGHTPAALDPPSLRLLNLKISGTATRGRIRNARRQRRSRTTP